MSESEMQPHLHTTAAGPEKLDSLREQVRPTAVEPTSEVSGVREGLQDQVELGVDLTADEQAALEEARQALKSGASSINDVLSKVLTVNAALIGGGVVIAKGEVFPQWWAVLVMVPLLLSLFCSILGLIPKERAIDTDDLESVLDYRNKKVDRLRAKYIAMLLCFAFFSSALVLAIVGVLLRSLTLF